MQKSIINQKLLFLFFRPTLIFRDISDFSKKEPILQLKLKFKQFCRNLILSAIGSAYCTRCHGPESTKKVFIYENCPKLHNPTGQ